MLTAAVLVNAANPAGYNPDPAQPGEYQRTLERYLEHLQIPYEIFDVASQGPPGDLPSRQLVIVAHRGVNLPADWDAALVAAVRGGTGLVNLDWDPAVGSLGYLRTIFGATGSHAAALGTSITVPRELGGGGASQHFITAWQIKFASDPPGDFVYGFHPDDSNVVRGVACTELDGAAGTVLARVGTAPLFLAASYGSGRAVHVGTLDYLKADRFGFLMGVDDLFWRSLVWAARKPFVVRGYPRYFAVQMDDTKPGWGTRVRDLYDTSLTGQQQDDGTGGPWKVTGFVYTNNLPPGSAERSSVIGDIAAGRLKIVPHTTVNTMYGDLYWNGSSGALTDAQWLGNLNQITSWKTGLGGADALPSFSRSLVAHYWDISNNTGYDLWNTLGFRYVTSIQKPGYQNYGDVGINAGEERLHARPFWVYEQPPKRHRDETYSFFFADDYPIGSRAGQPASTFFLFASQLQDPSVYPRADAIWPGAAGYTVADSVDQWKRYVWRFWSGLTPVQIYTHDDTNFELTSQADRRAAISEISSWLAGLGVRQLFMEQLGDALYARTKSLLTDARLSGSEVTYTYQGRAATASGSPVATGVMVFFDDTSEGVLDTVAGFTNGQVVTKPLPPPPPQVVSVSPALGTTAGGTTVSIAGLNFASIAAVRFGGTDALNFMVVSSTAITAVTPPGIVGPASVTVIGSSGTATAANAFTYVGPPRIDSLQPSYGPSQGGTAVLVTGQGFEPAGWVWFGGAAAPSVTYLGPTSLQVETPAGPTGTAEVRVGNAFGEAVLPSAFYYFPASGLWRMDFTYAARAELLAAGWDFLARGATGAPRNTEQTSGRVVSYDQTGHPGTIRIPSDQGTLWQSLNNSRNTLFFDLPQGWRSIRIKVANFAPAASYQQVSLAAYGDDDNYVALTRYYDSGISYRQAVEFASESGGTYLVTDRVQAPSGATIHLRLDREPSTNTYTAMTSTDGTNWTALGGSATRALTNPRLCINVGDNESTSSYPAADIAYAEIVAFDDSPLLTVAPARIDFTAVAGGADPAPVALGIGNGGGGTIAWTASDDRTWLSVSPASGTAAAGTSVTAGVAAAIAGLVPGAYSGTVTVSDPAAAGSPRSVPVTLTIHEAPASGVLLQDDFSDGVADGWQISPLGYAAGWSVAGGAYAYDGGGHTQSWRGDALWTDYSFETRFRLSSLSNFPGGVRARLDGTTGAAYTVWLYPASGEIRLFRAAGWDIDSPGLTLLGTASAVAFEPGVFHALKVALAGTTIEVFCDGLSVIRVDDATLAAGAIALDVSNQQIAFDDILVKAAGASENPLPALTSLSPSSRTAGGGAFTLTVNGSGFVAGSVVRWNGSDRTTTYVSAAQLAAAIGAADIATAGSVPVTVYTPAPGGGTSTAVSFAVSPPATAPTVSAVAPPGGPMSGGTPVQISGTGFVSGSTVMVGSASATSVVVNGTTSISAVTPSGVQGAAAVTVSNVNGSGTLAAGFTYHAPAPALTSLSPSSRTAGGGAFTLTVNGSGFVAGSVVRWNGSDRTTTYVSATRLTAAIGAADIAAGGNVAVTVSTPAPGGGVSNALTCAVNNPAPKLSSLSPSSATAKGASFTLTVNGSGFVRSSVVRWKGSDRTTTFVSSTRLKASITAADIAVSGTASVTVFNPAPMGGTSGALTFRIR